MSIEEIEREIVGEFSVYDDWMDKYAYLIEIGNGMPAMDEQYKTDDNLIKGCQSRVWFYPEMRGELLYFMADSDDHHYEGDSCLVGAGVFRSETRGDCQGRFEFH